MRKKKHKSFFFFLEKKPNLTKNAIQHIYTKGSEFQNKSNICAENRRKKIKEINEERKIPKNTLDA